MSTRVDTPDAAHEHARGALRRSAGILVVAAAVLVSIVACTSEPEVVEPVVTTPQASLEGEWVLTRTVTVSDDELNPDRAIGAVSTRFVSISQANCETALCPGTVSSGVSTEQRESTELNQVDGGLEWTFVGTLNCINQETGLVQVADAYEFTQSASLTVTETTDEGGVAVASKLEGTMSFTDSLTLEAHQAGCRRDPLVANVEYVITAVRATVEEPAPETEG